MGRTILLITILQATSLTIVYSGKQQVSLSDSYLPVAMQIIAHLTDQMTYEVQADDPGIPNKPTQKPPLSPKPTSSPPKPIYNPQKPVYNPPKPVLNPPKPVYNPPKPVYNPPKPVYNPPKPIYNPPKPAYNPPRPSSAGDPTTSKPVYVTSSPFEGSFQLSNGGWTMFYSTMRFQSTTPFHRPGLYAPVAPPKPGERLGYHGFLPPIDHISQYTVIKPLERPTEEPLLSMENTEIKPLMEPKPEKEPLLPPHFEGISSRTSLDLDDDELSDDNLQYLSPNVREMIKLANDPDAELNEDMRAGPTKPGGKGKLTTSNLRLQLLYDLLSREAKKQKLNDFSGFSDSVLRELADSSNGGARAQLSFALSKMVDRRDCDHEYANNRAKEIVAELGKDESKMSAEIRYLQPLIYRL